MRTQPVTTDGKVLKRVSLLFEDGMVILLPNVIELEIWEWGDECTVYLKRDGLGFTSKIFKHVKQLLVS